jgi:CHASE2 domain-containing sensor protein
MKVRKRIRSRRLIMKKFRTVISLIIMVIAGIVGFFIGASINDAMCGAILFSMISGIACIVYVIDNKND